MFFHLFKPLKRQTKIAADDILIFYFYLLKKIRLDFSCDSSAYIKSYFLQKNNEKIFINVVCCSRDWRFKGISGLLLWKIKLIQNRAYFYYFTWKICSYRSKFFSVRVDLRRETKKKCKEFPFTLYTMKNLPCVFLFAEGTLGFL